MAQVFISHSQRDEEYVNFFARAFIGVNVEPKFKEIDAVLGDAVSADQIKRDIDTSKAVFVIASRNVDVLAHTRDWVVSEAARAGNRDVWVFEPYCDLGHVSVIFPFLRHYAVFDLEEDWLRYLRSIVVSYVDTHAGTVVGVAGGLGALLAEHNRAGGAALAALAGLLFVPEAAKQPSGIPVTCLNALCRKSFQVHMRETVTRFRCPVCNYVLGWTDRAQSAVPW